MAFVGRTGSADVYVRDLATGNETNITNDRNRERGATISADGTLVAYESRSGDESELRVYSFESGQNRVVCQACGIPNAWSPDKKSLLASDGDPSQIFRVSVSDGARSEFIGVVDGFSVDSARYSPDGRWIAFAERDDAETIARVLIVAASPSGPVTRSDCIEITDREHFNIMPRWSPDGRSLYFLSDRAGSPDIWSVELGPDKRPRAEPRLVRTFDTTRFSFGTLPYRDIGYAIGGDRIYFALQEVTGRIYLMLPIDTVAESTP